MSDAADPGLIEAIARLAAVREQIGAAEIMAAFVTEHGGVEIVVDEDGFEMLVDGQPVPRVKR